MATYERLSIVEFGLGLLETLDLDPVYVALNRSRLSRVELTRFILGWMMYYHTGLACWMMTHKSKGLLSAFEYVAKHNDEFPRGSQRKHHRNAAALACVAGMQTQFSTATEFARWSLHDGCDGRDVMKRVMTLVGWGPCMSWRVPDLYEALSLYDTPFKSTDTDMFFSNPKRGALLCAKEYGLKGSDPVRAAHDYLMEEIGDKFAPPAFKRRLNIQETETVFCKWKSHMVGRYAIGRDTLRAKEQFEKYADKVPLSRKLLELMPC